MYVNYTSEMETWGRVNYGISKDVLLVFHIDSRSVRFTLEKTCVVDDTGLLLSQRSAPETISKRQEKDTRKSKVHLSPPVSCLTCLTDFNGSREITPFYVVSPAFLVKIVSFSFPHDPHYRPHTHPRYHQDSYPRVNTTKLGVDIRIT